MTNKQGPKAAGDNIIQQFEALRPLARVLSRFSPKIRKQLSEVKRQSENVKQMAAGRDLFAKTYSPLGWVLYDRLSTDAVAQALKMPVEEGEATLTSYHLNAGNLRFLGYRWLGAHNGYLLG